MTFWTRKRTRSDSDDVPAFWEEHKATIDELVKKDFAVVSKVYHSSMQSSLKFPVRARLPIKILNKLSAEDLRVAHAQLESRTLAKPPFICMHLKFEKTRPSQSPPTRGVQKPVADLSAQTSEIQSTLQLRNSAAIKTVQQVIQLVRNSYACEMEWDSGFPYEIVFHKKHTQLVIRFHLINQKPQLHPLPLLGLNAEAWVEFDKVTQSFGLIVLVRDCV